jgi:hypothetical protein
MGQLGHRHEASGERHIAEFRFPWQIVALFTVIIPCHCRSKQESVWPEHMRPLTEQSRANQSDAIPLSFVRCASTCWDITNLVASTNS